MMRDRLLQIAASGAATGEEVQTIALGLLWCREDASALRKRIRELEHELIDVRRDLGHCNGNLEQAKQAFNLVCGQLEKLRGQLRATGVLANAPTLAPPPGDDEVES